MADSRELFIEHCEAVRKPATRVRTLPTGEYVTAADMRALRGESALTPRMLDFLLAVFNAGARPGIRVVRSDAADPGTRVVAAVHADPECPAVGILCTGAQSVAASWAPMAQRVRECPDALAGSLARLAAGRNAPLDTPALVRFEIPDFSAPLLALPFVAHHFAAFLPPPASQTDAATLCEIYTTIVYLGQASAPA